MMDITMMSSNRIDAEIAVEHTVRWSNTVGYSYGIDYNDLRKVRETCKFAHLIGLYFSDQMLAIQELAKWIERVPFEYSQGYTIEILVPRGLSCNEVAKLYKDVQNYIIAYCSDHSIKMDFTWGICSSSDKLKQPEMEIRIMLAMPKTGDDDDEYIKDALERYNQQMSEKSDENYQTNITL